MASALLGAVAGLLGVLIGVSSSWLLTRRQHQLSMTLAMHREFNTGDLATSRHLAWKLLLDHPPKTYLELYREIPPDQMQHVWAVAYFYQRLWVLIKHGHIRSDYVPELFADIFYSWIKSTFEQQLLPLQSQVARDVAALGEWMDKHTTLDDRRRALEENAAWDRRGEPDLAGRHNGPGRRHVSRLVRKRRHIPG